MVQQAISARSLGIIGSIVFFFLGCPPPDWKSMWFESGQQYSNTSRIEPTGVPVRLTIRGEYGIRLHFDTIRISVRAQYLGNADDLCYQFDKIRLVIGDYEPQLTPGVLQYTPKPGTGSELVSNYAEGALKLLAFIPEREQKQAHGLAPQDTEPVPFHLVLDSFLLFRGKPVPLDTIHGCAKCWSGHLPPDH